VRAEPDEAKCLLGRGGKVSEISMLSSAGTRPCEIVPVSDGDYSKESETAGTAGTEKHLWDLHENSLASPK
jgi:hypothetical protein